MNLNEQPREMMYSEPVIPDNVDYHLGKRDVYYFRDEEENVYLHHRCMWEVFWNPPYWDGSFINDDEEYVDMYSVETIIVRPKIKCWGKGLNKRL